MIQKHIIFIQCLPPHLQGEAKRMMKKRKHALRHMAHCSYTPKSRPRDYAKWAEALSRGKRQFNKLALRCRPYAFSSKDFPGWH